MVVKVLIDLWWSGAGVLTWTDLLESLDSNSRHWLLNMASQCAAGHNAHIPCPGLKLRHLR